MKYERNLETGKFGDLGARGIAEPIAEPEARRNMAATSERSKRKPRTETTRSVVGEPK